jgi:hypothetical protein
MSIRFLSVILAFVPIAAAQTFHPYSIFATGSAVSATGPDSITVGNGSVWVSYTNTSVSTGGGSSTVVQYSLDGKVQHTYSIAGSVDGLKIEPRTGLVWALQNQDGNSTLTLIDPLYGTTSFLHYAVTLTMQGYDDVAFDGNKIFLSYTNPVLSTDPTIQLLENRSSPLIVTPVLTMGATGVNLATGQSNQSTTQNDPDSLKTTPGGDLVLTSGDDGQLIFVSRPGTPNQSVSFLTLLDPSTGNAVSGLDDAVFVTAEAGTFYLSDTNNNRVLTIPAEGLKPGTLYACIGSLNEFAKVDLATGFVTAIVPNLKAPHGLVFIPSGNDNNQGDDNSGGNEQ